MRLEKTRNLSRRVRNTSPATNEDAARHNTTPHQPTNQRLHNSKRHRKTLPEPQHRRKPDTQPAQYPVRSTLTRSRSDNQTAGVTGLATTQRGSGYARRLAGHLRQCCGSGHRNLMCQDIGTSRCWSRVGDVEGPSGCQSCCCGGANPRRSGRPVRPVEVVGYPLGGPIPLGGRHRFRGSVPSAAHIADGDPCRGGRAGGEPTLRAVCPGPRRRPPHDRLAPPTAPPDHRVALDDPAPPC